MNNQNIIKELAKIYLLVDDARAKLEELETDARIGWDDKDNYFEDPEYYKYEELMLEINDLIGCSSQLAEDIEQTEGVEAAIAEAAGFTEIVMDPKKFHVTYTKEEAK